MGIKVNYAKNYCCCSSDHNGVLYHHGHDNCEHRQEKILKRRGGLVSGEGDVGGLVLRGSSFGHTQFFKK